MERNGLRAFGFHTHQRQPVADALDTSVTQQSLLPPSKVDPETVARMYVQQALASADVPEFTTEAVRGQQAEFKSLGVEKIPLTGTQTVKFRQFYRGIPVYGSLVTVELDENHKLLALNSSVGTPDVDPVAEISVKQAIDIIKQAAGYPADYQLDVSPRLSYYFAAKDQKWYLVYVAENVLKASPRAPTQHGLPEVVDYVVCAHTGVVVAALPRTMTAGAAAAPAAGPAAPAAPGDGLMPAGWAKKVLEVPDELGHLRKLVAITNGQAIRLYDPDHNVLTYDFRFKDIDLQAGKLPGDFVETADPKQWVEGAVSAHANAAAVAEFYKTVLLRNGLDNMGGKYVSSIQCCSVFNGGAVQAWHNAAWIGTQMVYGQRLVAQGQAQAWHSFARALEVVAHEITHGLTDRTARLQYQGMTGALNESYSDIFGTLIANWGRPDRRDSPTSEGAWQWQIGQAVSESGVPIRSLADPTLFGQPAHMKDYKETANDNGGVHTNSGVHNKAFYNLATAPDGAGGYLLDDRTLAYLFYLALTQHLSQTSQFPDSRRAVGLVAQTLFRNDGDGPRTRKLQAIAKAFDDVGIVEE